jgi:hypothetical protein
MTYPNGWPAPPSPGPPYRPNQQRNNLVLLSIGLIALGAVIAVVIVLVGLNNSSRNTGPATIGTTTTASANPGGTSNDWVQSVCRAIIRGVPPALQNATKKAICSSPSGVAITIGQYTSYSGLQSDLYYYKAGLPFTTGQASNGIWLFIGGDRSASQSEAAATLSPLKAFGFQIQWNRQVI